ncbi:MAG: LytR/AlgR family response regulator transcription factor [Thermaurantimonas sp.]
MKCIVIEDEILAQEIHINYIERVEKLKLIGLFSNAPEAITFLKNNSAEIIFLDIHMPVLNGIDFLKSIYPRPFVVITSAYPQYALESYNFEVLDYLLKPFSFERFSQAVLKIDSYKQKLLEKGFEPVLTDHIFVKADRKLLKINLSDILFVEGFGNYVKIYTPMEVILTREKMSDIENVLPTSRFIRVHKSYIVAIRHIHRVDSETIYISKYFIPIGNSYKSIFFARVHQPE